MLAVVSYLIPIMYLSIGKEKILSCRVLFCFSPQMLWIEGFYLLSACVSGARRQNEDSYVHLKAWWSCCDLHGSPISLQ